MRSLKALVSTSRTLRRCSTFTAPAPSPFATFQVPSYATTWPSHLCCKVVREQRRGFTPASTLWRDRENPGARGVADQISSGNDQQQDTSKTPQKNTLSEGSPTHGPPTKRTLHNQPDPPSSTAELPSESLSRRNDLTVRLQRLTDRLMTAFTLASHRVNTLTGTDYSAIAALRESIAQQESDVKGGHAALSKARTTHDAAVATQAASQKEVVQLLERKQSWSAADLERYMSLIRSEHINEQGVSAAREELERCEATLEVARQKVEQAERKQYHEEQIWSDTIRRNSTWVTFGLMGLNILLLIVNLVMIEPWRRKRMVKEIRTALDEKTFAANTAVAVGGEAMGETDQELSQAEPSTDEVLKEVVAAHATKGGEIALSTDVDAIQTEADGEGTPRRFRDRILGTVNSWFQDAWEWANFMLSEEHHIIISRVDLTTAVAEAWAIGATCMLLLFVTVPIDLSDVFR